MDILTSGIRKYRYDYFKGLLSGDFKKLYKTKCNYVFEKLQMFLNFTDYLFH